MNVDFRNRRQEIFRLARPRLPRLVVRMAARELELNRTHISVLDMLDELLVSKIIYTLFSQRDSFICLKSKRLILSPQII